MILAALTRVLGVRYTYADSPSTLPPNDPAASLTHQALNPLPPDILQSMHQAVIAGDISALEALINQVFQIDPHIARVLHELAEQYDYAALNTFNDAYKPSCIR